MQTQSPHPHHRQQQHHHHHHHQQLLLQPVSPCLTHLLLPLLLLLLWVPELPQLPAGS
jgi:hypothetical protein